ncbi:MAG: CsbD family protein [Alphaproteobacteria bacterium]|nr:CsbD family protein [Alphaproteobacteria bacterium]
MNENQMKGAAKDAAGKVQKAVGDLTDNPKHQAEGIGKQIAGKAQKAVGDVQDGVKDATKKVHKEQEKKGW